MPTSVGYVAPLLSADPAVMYPWHIRRDLGVIAVHQLATIPVDRLLERIEVVDSTTLRLVRLVVREFIG
jgi:hypothetical protein